MLKITSESNRRLTSRIADLVLSSIGVFFLAWLVPWKFVFLPTTLCGGDNPAHPVLMQSLAESFFSHRSLIHYSYRFWGGFEAFQFYFPLPYLSGALIARWIHPGVAFKLVTLFGILGLPVGFYWMAESLGFSWPTRLLAMLLSLPFLYTKAHVMWGGNIFSALAGMIGNAWAFVFFVLAFGKIVQAHAKRAFSFAALVLSLLATLSHFYAFLMLLVLFSALAVFDGVHFMLHRQLPPWRTYLIGIYLVLLMSWWLLPLVYYSPFSSDLGGDWGIQLLQTFTPAEQVVFWLSIFVGSWQLIRTRFQNQALVTAFLFLGISLCLFFFNRFFNTGFAVLLDVRLWPGIYFALYLVVIFAVDILYRTMPPILFPIVLIGFYFLIPPQARFDEGRSWMQWNFRGVERSPGWTELAAALKQIEHDPPGRISYEAYGSYANGTFGSVRAMELLPYFSPHDIILGGIVNSASYAGIGYFLQCLMSNEGAGWPPGSVMPNKDIARGADMMKALGIRYHIAFRPENRTLLDRASEFRRVFSGRFMALYELKAPVQMVEVYAGPLPVYSSSHYRSTLLNLPRWDIARNAGIIFNPRVQRAPALSGNPELTLRPFLTYLVDQWNTKKRVYDLGWQGRPDRISGKLNLYLFTRGKKLDSNRIGTDETEFMIADRGFDPELFILKGREKYAEVALPLLRSHPGRAMLQINGQGYRAFVDGKQIPLNAPAAVDFRMTKFGEAEAPFAWILLQPEGKIHYAEPRSDDPEVHSGFPGPTASAIFPDRITDACQPWLERSYGRLVLHTRCPGKPHLIKYSYYPKWKSDVPIFIGTNGFMVLTPHAETTVLQHTPGIIDYLGEGASAAAAIGLGLYCLLFWRKRPPENLMSGSFAGSLDKNR